MGICLESIIDGDEIVIGDELLTTLDEVVNGVADIGAVEKGTDLCMLAVSTSIR